MPAKTDFVPVDFADMTVAAAITKARRTAGCRIKDLHPSVVDHAVSMSHAQREAARRPQTRLITERLRKLEAASKGADAPYRAALELAAASRIAYLYDTRLRTLAQD
ncbi:hypothetical protein MWU52_17165 [Jannaschia sp. S6380]|uniref:hypothetical protein n=1 Tax=Jannaschia sp. S6380 TaxID=2926408 RepID=UPI001FF303AA|nr:hypothetical protein [Jannaschia sp. S6380]MCK0169287.1 hypothetical protein [Jannaschia sp. S6380]